MYTQIFAHNQTKKKKCNSVEWEKKSMVEKARKKKERKEQTGGLCGPKKKGRDQDYRKGDPIPIVSQQQLHSVLLGSQPHLTRIITNTQRKVLVVQGTGSQ